MLSLSRLNVPALIATLGPTQNGSPPPWDKALALQLADSFPVLFLVVAIPILFLRFDDRNAWLLAFVFAGFVACAPIAFREGAIHPALRGFALAYMFAFYGSAPALFYFFCTVFPNPSPLDRRFPYLKYFLLVIAGVTSVSIAAAVLIRGSLAPAISVAQLWPGLVPIVVVYMFCGFFFGLVALVWNSISATDVVTRRKTRVMVWGTVGAFAPGMLLTLFAFVGKQNVYTLPFWVWITPILMLSLMPLAFAYAVLRQRGFVVLIVGAGVAATIVLARQLEQSSSARGSAVLVGVAFGVGFVYAGTQVQARVTRRLDRAFFRSAYDARLVLEDLAAKTRSAESQEGLAALLREHINNALHPTALGIYFSDRGGQLVAMDHSTAVKLPSIPEDLPWLLALANFGSPQEVSPDSPNDQTFHSYAPDQPECLVPIQRRNGELLGLIVLGQRLSEEPYSREDKRLLQSVANQAGVALENMRLAQEMATPHRERTSRCAGDGNRSPGAKPSTSAAGAQAEYPRMRRQMYPDAGGRRRLLRLSGSRFGALGPGVGRYFRQGHGGCTSYGQLASQSAQSVCPGARGHLPSSALGEQALLPEHRNWQFRDHVFCRLRR
jgi:phosphoserine phosphatase RsbU/P